MDDPFPGTRFRLKTGHDVLDAWEAVAGQCRKEAVHAALFAMLDGSLFHTYRVIDDLQRPNELFVVIQDDLILKIRIHCVDSFGVVHIDDRAGR